MTNFVLAYTGGKSGDTPEEQQAIMAAWTAWLGGLGDALVGAGNPFAGSTPRTSSATSTPTPAAAGSRSTRSSR